MRKKIRVEEMGTRFPAFRLRGGDMSDATHRPEALDHPWVPKMLRLYSMANVWLYQRTEGRLGSTWRVGAAFPHGVPVLLLTTKGRKTGAPRTAPLLYLRDGERLIIVGSQGGLPNHPQWFLNLIQHPQVEVQVGAEVRTMHGRVATPEEREQLWPRLVALYADFAKYQSWTERTIPVVILTPETAQAQAQA
jgi:deazaflavin-dependent oxidoreductase (nitroreductase family)